MKRFCLVAVIFTTLSVAAQQSKNDETVLGTAEVAAWSILQAQSARRTDDPNYIPAEPNTKEKVTEPGLVCFKSDNGTSTMDCTLDWTAGQQAHSLMEHLRIGIYELQSGKNIAVEALAIRQATDVWPDLRNIYCREYPAGMYYDLQGQMQFCEGRRRK